MGVQTRSATSSPMKKHPTSDVPIAPSTDSEQPLKVLIGPRNLSRGARFVVLKHPRDGSAKRFIFCPNKGLFELTQITPTLEPRSILFTAQEQDQDPIPITESPSKSNTDDDRQLSTGYVKQDSNLFIATPFDIAFILVAILVPVGGKTSPAMFQPLDDLLEGHELQDKHLQYILSNGQKFVRSAMQTICDTVEAGDETMFRYSESRILEFLLDKARTASDKGLPASMEDKYVTRALEAPVLSVKHTKTAHVVIPDLQSDSTTEASSFIENSNSQSSTSSTAVSAVFSEVSATSSVSTQDTPSVDLRKLQRMKTAFNFILVSYLPLSLSQRFERAICSIESPINFQLLDAHLKHLATLRTEALSSRSMADFSRKRRNSDDEEIAEMKAEKKRKQEEEEKKRKANESRGVRNLKKVNVAGMKKMSDFFSRAPANKAKS